VAATRTNAFALLDGRLIAAKQAATIEFFLPISPDQAAHVTRLLRSSALRYRDASDPSSIVGMPRRAARAV
jgi:hypothetical protein